MGARLRSSLTFAVLVVAGGGCAIHQVEREVAPDLPTSSDEARTDLERCRGDELELASLIQTGACSIPMSTARPLPLAQLELRAPPSLQVAPGERLEFDLRLRNRSEAEVEVDLRLREFLPIGPQRTVGPDDDDAIDSSCTLRPISTDPPPERVSLPPGAELRIPARWHANRRLVDPVSYVGSECPDFPPLEPGRYRSRFVLDGVEGSRLELEVEIEVRAPAR